MPPHRNYPVWRQIGHGSGRQPERPPRSPASRDEDDDDIQPAHNWKHHRFPPRDHPSSAHRVVMLCDGFGRHKGVLLHSLARPATRVKMLQPATTPRRRAWIMGTTMGSRMNAPIPPPTHQNLPRAQPQRLVTGTPHPLATTGTHVTWSTRVARVRDHPHRAAPPSTLTYPCPPSPISPPYYCAIPAREQPPHSTSPTLAHPTSPLVARIHEHAHVRRPLRLRAHACLFPRPPLSSPTFTGTHPAAIRVVTRLINDRVVLPRAARLARQSHSFL
ncbi:hypothetical protein HD554DRAFT_2329501 [Boletus coccyginus]|nr:hypothetical protein HD554DRAFT_2329501 [Boletus coccyginus]